MKQMTVLNDDQRSAVAKLEKLRVGALFMEPGTGKTRTALNLIESSQTGYVIFIVPFQTKENLRAEIEKWGISKPFEIVGVETISSSDREYIRLVNKLGSVAKPFIVVDESTKIKNSSAIRTRRVIQLGLQAYYKLILNGTPLTKNILDLWSQMYFLSPKILNMREYEFKNTFAEYTHFQDDSGGWRDYISGYANLDYLYSLIDPYVYGCRLDLGVQQRAEQVPFFVTDSMKEYRQIKQDYLESYVQTPDSFLRMATKMQDCYALESHKFKQVAELITDHTLIFVKFIKCIQPLQEQFPQARVMTYGKGSLGLNLQEYNRIIFWDQTFNYAQLEQAKRRIYRLGQDKNVDYFTLVGDVGLEKMIQHNVASKTTLLEAFKRAATKGKKGELLNAL